MLGDSDKREEKQYCKKNIIHSLRCSHFPQDSYNLLQKQNIFYRTIHTMCKFPQRDGEMAVKVRPCMLEFAERKRKNKYSTLGSFILLVIVLVFRGIKISDIERKGISKRSNKVVAWYFSQNISLILLCCSLVYIR